MHAFDRRTDRQTDGQTDGRTDRILIVRPRLHSMQRGKNGGVDSFVIKEWIEHATFLDCYVSHGRPRARFIRGGEKILHLFGR